MGIGLVRKFAMLLTANACLLASFASAAPAEVLGFQDWKKERVNDARAALEKLVPPPPDKSLVSSSSATAPQATKKTLPVSTPKGRSDQKLQSQAQLNLDIAQELTVNDYFLLYLSQFKSRDTFLEVAKKLTPEETADLMLAYQKHLTGSQDLDVLAPTSAGLTTPPSAH